MVQPQNNPQSSELGSGCEPLLISVDNVGQFLAVCARELVLGHISDGQADLPFLANVGARHALFTRRDSLREGTVWWVQPLEGQGLTVNQSPLHEPHALLPGDLLGLSDNLSMCYRCPDPASQSALLILQGSQECLGAQRIVLFAEGPGGRLRLGSAEQRLIQVPNLEAQLFLECEAERLRIQCSEPGLSWSGGSGAQSVELELPLKRREQIALGAAQAGRPPFSLGIATPAPIGSAREPGAS